MLDDIFEKYFKSIKASNKRNLLFLVKGMMRSGTASPWHASQSMCVENDQSFKTNEKKANRLLRDPDFQINDSLFRKYMNLLFDVMQERGLLKEGDNIQINVDYTSDTDDFLILMASINFSGRAVPLYFSMRSYPKNKGQHDQKKLESSFMRELRHLLSKRYSYTIVADRGFGNDRFAELCIQNGFDFTLRIRDNLNIKVDGKACKLSDYAGKNIKIKAHVFAWEKDVDIEVCTEKGSSWFLLLSSGDISGHETYKKRFSIEKCFQDQKSSGFNIEKCKIRKYDRFKRLYFSMCLAQLFVVMIGEYIENENHPLKKRFHIYANVISAYSDLDGTLADRFLIK